MKTGAFLFTFALMCLLVTGCYYDNEEDLYPENTCVTNNMSYSNNILQILEDNCYTCHSMVSNQGGVTLEGYNNLKNYVDNGKLIGVINHEPGFPAMPQGGSKLGQCQIDKIEAWVDQGSLNN